MRRTFWPSNMPDDNGWSHMTLIGRTAVVEDPLSDKLANPITSSWTYNYNLEHLSAQECGDCQYGMYWGNANDGDYQDFYNGTFTGFYFAKALNPDTSLDETYSYSTEGWGVWDPTLVSCHDGQTTCPESAGWDVINAASGHPYEQVWYGIPQSGVYPLLKEAQTSYTAVCPTSTIAASPAPTNGPYTGYTWHSHLVSEADQDNPRVLCDIQTASATSYQAEGQSSPSSTNSPQSIVTNSYDTTNPYGHLYSSTTTGNDLGSTPTTVQQMEYLWHDAITPTATSATGTYIVDRAEGQYIKDGSGNVQSCAFMAYDGLAFSTGSTSGLVKGLETASESEADCIHYTGVAKTTTAYNTNGDPISTIDADANGGISGHTATTGACTGSTACTTYDSMGGCGCGPGTACMPSPRTMPHGEPGTPSSSCQERSCGSKSSIFPIPPKCLNRCGSGGGGQFRLVWRRCGACTSLASLSNTHSVFSNRSSNGRPPSCARPTPPIAGPGCSS